MTDIQFGRLVDLPLREAWQHEALKFTPWLAENIDHLSEAIGISLELTGTEVAVESFSADILARDEDDNVVLIENQLEQTDHTHLGQIMTYLAGLDAQTVVWVAPAFREPHLSAIRWLNEHTADGFSFFAVKARVVRIENSPFAPIFEVVGKPDDWSRKLTKKAKSAKSELSLSRENFWQLYLDRHPEAARHGIRPSAASTQWLDVIPGKLILGRYVASKSSGIYLRGPTGQNVEEVTQLLLPFKEQIEARLGGTFFDGGGWHVVNSTPHPIGQPDGWPKAVDFMQSKTETYLTLLREIFPEIKP
ncbi:hypothetical protein ACGYKB_13690 [Sulfitobacter sp. 916]|uniref:hypothetical protein n=1 Tax=Sulfitobacter sp. 916 TaxID=3368559 RepID=UPI00374697E9|tara:strand:+ start:274 stop:1188 length:915 start_codon:yes stop_codon:yes gene_type:complete